MPPWTCSATGRSPASGVTTIAGLPSGVRCSDARAGSRPYCATIPGSSLPPCPRATAASGPAGCGRLSRLARQRHRVRHDFPAVSVFRRPLLGGRRCPGADPGSHPHPDDRPGAVRHGHKSRLGPGCSRCPNLVQFRRSRPGNPRVSALRHPYRSRDPARPRLPFRGIAECALCRILCPQVRERAGLQLKARRPCGCKCGGRSRFGVADFAVAYGD